MYQSKELEQKQKFTAEINDKTIKREGEILSYSVFYRISGFVTN